MKYLHTKHRFIRHLPVLPFIYPAILFIFLLDIWVELYHRIAFPFYNIPYVNRKEYIRIDRHRLKYLNILQKLNCMYCGYANGVIHYIAVIIGETEKYWCGIQHKQEANFHPPQHHANFIPYNDPSAFQETYAAEKTGML